MTFIITLLALIVERFFHWSHLRNWQWFDRYQYFLNVRGQNSHVYLLLAACIIPLTLVTAVFSYLLSGWGHHLPSIIFETAVLLYCFGPHNFWVQVYAGIRALNQNDPQLALESIKIISGTDTMDSTPSFRHVFTRNIFIAANQYIFGVIIWFVFLGPAGAVLYRTVNLCARNSTFTASSTAIRLQQLLDWIPARLLALLFALGGHFTQVFSVWKLKAKKGLKSNESLLGDCGLSAVSENHVDMISQDGSVEKEALGLLDRAFIILLILLAVVGLAL